MPSGKPVVWEVVMWEALRPNKNENVSVVKQKGIIA